MYFYSYARLHLIDRKLMNEFDVGKHSVNPKRNVSSWLASIGYIVPAMIDAPYTHVYVHMYVWCITMNRDTSMGTT